MGTVWRRGEGEEGEGERITVKHSREKRGGERETDRHFPTWRGSFE
jgi:hypothetical protein